MISIELDELSEEEYGSDLTYNSLPTIYNYDGLSDNDSVDYEDGNQDAYLDDQSAFDYVNKNESFDKDWLLRYLYVMLFIFLTY